MPRATSALVTAPVPEPSSMTGPALSGSTQRAIARASILPDGVTAPIESGLSIQCRMKATSSRKRRPLFRSKRRIRLSIFFSSICKASNGMGGCDFTH